MPLNVDLINAGRIYTNELFVDGQFVFSAKEITHSELLKLQKTNKLTEGRWYKITDFQTKYKVISKIYNEVTLPSFGEPLVSGPIEPLYVRALSKNKLQKETYSEAYPQDIIYYEIEDPFNEFGRPLTYNLNFENLPSGYYTDRVEYFEVMDPYDSTNFSQIIITFDNVGDIIDVKFNNTYYKENYQYRIYNYEGIYGFVTPLTIEKFGGDKGYITRRVDTINDISVQGDWRVIKYRRWAFEKLSGATTSGVFYTGEIVTGSVSGTKGYLDYYQGDGTNGSFGIKRNNASYFPTFGGQFQVGETITGEKSGAEATIISIDIDDIYEGKNPIPSNPGEINSENSLEFNSLVNPTSFPIVGYANQTLTFLQDTTTGIGVGFEVEIEFDSSGFIQNYIVINGGQNYNYNDLITTNDLGSGSINLKVNGTKFSELTFGVKCYVQSGTALYNGVEYNVGETFELISDLFSSLNPLEYFQQVGPTPVVVKKLWNCVCFDNGLPYDDFTIFNEALLKQGSIKNINFTLAGGNNDYWKFNGKEYSRSLTYLGTVIIRVCKDINVGALLDCSATSIRGLKSLDPERPGRVFETVFANFDGGGGNIQFDSELCCNVLCHSFNGEPLKVGRLSGLITTNQVGISDVEISEATEVTFGSEQSTYSSILKSKFICNLNNWFSTKNINYNNLFGEYNNWFVDGELINNNISVEGSTSITIKSNFKNNNITSIAFFGCIFESNFVNNQISVELFRDNIFSGFTAFNTINNSLFRNNIFQANFESNTFKGGQFIYNTNIINNFQKNNIGATINSTDFLTATHVYAPYNTLVYERPDGSVKLRFYDDSDNVVVDDITD